MGNVTLAMSVIVTAVKIKRNFIENCETFEIKALSNKPEQLKSNQLFRANS